MAVGGAPDGRDAHREPPGLSAQRVYAFWALRLGKLPDEVDELPLEWSSGWLLDQMMALETNPDEWWKNKPVGFVDDEDESWGGAFEPPAGYERLPMHEEVSDGE